jgi:hypothetical protein
MPKSVGLILETRQNPLASRNWDKTTSLGRGAPPRPRSWGPNSPKPPENVIPIPVGEREGGLENSNSAYCC